MPGVAIFVVSLGFNLLGDGLRDVARSEGGRAMTERRCSRSRSARRASRPRRRRAEAVRGVSFTLGRERLGIVGESGSGKSQTGRAILGLDRARGPGHAPRRLEFDGIDLLRCPPQQRRELRGGRIAMVLQDPKFSLEPGDDDRRADRRDAAAHQRASAREARARALDALEAVQIRRPRARLRPLPARGLRRHGPARDDRHDADRRTRTC